MPERASGRIYNGRFIIVPGTARAEEMRFWASQAWSGSFPLRTDTL